MIFGNIYDPEWRNRQLLKELKIDGKEQGDEDEETDYSADDDTSEDGGESEAPTTDDAGGDEGETDYTADDDTEGDDTTDDVTDADAGGGDEGETDYTADDDTETDGGGEGAPAPTGDAAPADGGDSGGDSGETDYSAEDDTEGDSGDEGGSNDNADQENDDGSEGGDQEDIKLGEDDPQSLAIKNLELKQNYQQMYMACEDIVNKISQVTKTSDASRVLKRVVDTTTKLKKIIEFYITNTYATKSYIENAINFQKYLTILNSIRNILNDTCENCKNENDLKESVADLFKNL